MQRRNKTRWPRYLRVRARRQAITRRIIRPKDAKLDWSVVTWAALAAALTMPFPRANASEPDAATTVIGADEPRLGRRIPVVQSRVAGGVDGDGETTRHVRLGVAGPIPLWTNGRARLMARTGYQLDRFRFDGTPDDRGLLNDEFTLHTFTLALAGFVPLSPTWGMSLEAGTQFASDARSYSDDAWIPSGRLGFRWKANESLQLIIGAAVTRPLGALAGLDLPVIVLPSLGLIYRPAGASWSLQLLLPALAQFRWSLSDSFELYSQVALSATNAARSSGDGRVAHMLSASDLEASVGIRYAFASNFDIGLGLGVQPFRQVILRPEDTDELETISLGAGYALTLQVGLRP